MSEEFERDPNTNEVRRVFDPFPDGGDEPRPTGTKPTAVVSSVIRQASSSGAVSTTPPSDPLAEVEKVLSGLRELAKGFEGLDGEMEGILSDHAATLTTALAGLVERPVAAEEAAFLEAARRVVEYLKGRVGHSYRPDRPPCNCTGCYVLRILTEGEKEASRE